ncbi:MAG: adenosylcobalamin-dependent ribonucleoside-diphosphate reductase [Thaumarchaeota archaeon]|nr:adenosylcobalamin-dependent ribonucleoside-diphosphate reductase [Candidatus Calditenuaceae archaeon]MDW8043109.1 adenosylcobalamin-dependent ribonucleoside-diphosphate reductase [Nitrososphaerota archaeon]
MTGANSYPVKRIVKRDGRVVEFDPERIRNAIRKAMIATNKLDEQLLDKVTEHVLNLVAEKFGETRIPHVEDVQDLVELSLVKFDLYEVAKAYILYRKERERIRKEKMRILERDYLDEVDKSFSVNSLRLMAARYLLRDPETGKLIEGPKQMFQRVAALIVIPDVLYDPKVFDVSRSQKVNPTEGFDPDLWSGKMGLRGPDGQLLFTWNRWHLERMKALYDRLNSEGAMKVRFSEVVEMIRRGEFDDHARDYLAYYSMMAEKKFMPNSPTLFNAGARLGQLSACFVLPIEDNMESIMRSAYEAAMIFKSGGGIGINYSKLRPEGDIVASTSGVASGPVTFMRIIDTVTDVVKQGGKRRGANMGILESWHPDVEKFIRAKERPGFLENFNISVMIEPKFWEFYERNEPYPLVNPRDGKVWSTVNPRQLFNMIAEAAWKTADPGVLFLDNINRRNILREALGEIRATNPCAEEPLYEYEVCNLGSVNLYAFVKRVDGKAVIDWEGLAETVRTAYRFLDNVIDVNNYPLKEIDEMARRTRRVGLGFMGLADMLLALRIPYHSEEGFALMQRVSEFIAWHAYFESARRAKERGPFPLYWQSGYPKGELPLEGYYHRELWTMDWDSLIRHIRANGMRNSFVLSVAPTGSISMLVDTSSGIEPVFALVYEKRVTVGTFYYIDPEFERYLEEKGMKRDDVLKAVSDNGGSIQGLEELFDEEARKVFVVAYDIPWWDHVRAQYHVGLWVDASVSKTINMPNWVTAEDVKNAYLFSYKLGLKGITIYRDQSKSSQVLVTPSQRTRQYFTPVKNNTLEMMRALGIEVAVESAPAHEEAAPKLILKVAVGEEAETEVEERSATGGLHAERCPSCGGKRIAHQEGCATCLDCGWSACLTA